MRKKCNVDGVNFTIFLFVINLAIEVNTQGWNNRDRRPIVRIPQGIIEGSQNFTDSSKLVNSFLGIPFAAPPLGDLRFAPPRSHPGWNGTLRATSYGANCPQLPIKSGLTDQEDCLFLNIWSPEGFNLQPVVVFFGGKDFHSSSEPPISGQDLASSESLVVVTINYRLNVFGFFCLGSSEARGNLGLLDQYLGLLWIRQNIRNFGGDPEKITLFGHASGAVSVTYHMISPRTAGLFQRAILSLGSALSPWQVTNDPVVASNQIIRMLGCDSYVSDRLACIRSKRTDDILQALQEYSDSFNWNDKFLPVVDSFLPAHNRYLPLDTVAALKDGTYLQVPVLTGISKPIVDEQFSQWIELASQGYFQLRQYTEKAKIPEVIRTYKFDRSLNKNMIADLIKWKYFSSDQEDARILFEQLKDLEFQAKIEAPHFIHLSYLVSTYVQPIFVYFMDDIGFKINSTDSTITSDLLLIFGPILLRQVGGREFSSNQSKLSREFKQLLMNFIIFGNPTPNHRQNIWRKYTGNDHYIRDLGSSNGYSDYISEEINRKISERIYFWNQLLPKIADDRNNIASNIPKELQNSPDPAAGFRHAMYTLLALVLALLALLVVCIALLKKRSKGGQSHLHLGY